MLRADPWTRAETPEDIIILKPDQNSPHGQVTEQNKIGNSRYAHDVQPITLAHGSDCFGEFIGGHFFFN